MAKASQSTDESKPSRKHDTEGEPTPKPRGRKPRAEPASDAPPPPAPAPFMNSPIGRADVPARPVEPPRPEPVRIEPPRMDQPARPEFREPRESRDGGGEFREQRPMFREQRGDGGGGGGGRPEFRSQRPEFRDGGGGGGGGQGNRQGGRPEYREQRPDFRDQQTNRPERSDRGDRSEQSGRDQGPRDQASRDGGAPSDQARDSSRPEGGGSDQPRADGDQGQRQGENRPFPQQQNRPFGQGGQGGGGQGGQGGQGGGGGGDREDRFGRRKKKRRKGGGQGGGGNGINVMAGMPPIRSFELPSDEELEREAAELEKTIAGTDPKSMATVSIAELQTMDIGDLQKIAERENFTDYHQLSKHDLIFKILKARAAKQGLMFGEGSLEVMPDGFGFLRSPDQSYLPGPDDIYIAPTQIRRYGLRRGMVIRGIVRPPKEAERYFAMLRVDKVNNREPSKVAEMRNFEDLTPMHPEKRFVLETTPDEIECRTIDLVTPIGKGQRMLIVAPPRTGKTVLMQKMTKAITKNYPEVRIIVLLVDERPEEVTDFKRNCQGPNIEVVASTFDENSGRHVQVAEMVIEKARRMVEFGDDVVILLDSITRLARAYNAEMPHSGKIMTGGLDSNALQRPKKFFGSARAIEKGGSMTIIGTALVDTGSKMDEIIFEEFKGTGNAELHLDRKLVEKRIWPAIDVAASGTRREELLMDSKELELIYRLRKVLSDMNVVEAMELLKGRLKKVKTNAEFLMTMAMG